MKPLDYILLAVFSGALLIVGSFLTSEQSADRLRRSGFHAAKRSGWAAAAERALGQRQPCLESLAGGPGAPARPPTLSEGGGAGWRDDWEVAAWTVLLPYSAVIARKCLVPTVGRDRSPLLAMTFTKEGSKKG